MSQPEFPAAFRGSPMKRAKLRRLKRNAAVVLGSDDAVTQPAHVADDRRGKQVEVQDWSRNASVG
jgi:epoxyqueuosine reductase